MFREGQSVFARSAGTPPCPSAGVHRPDPWWPPRPVGIVALGALRQRADRIIVIALARRLLTETPSRNGHFDVRGALTSTIGVTSLAYGFCAPPPPGGATPTVASFAAASSSWRRSSCSSAARRSRSRHCDSSLTAVAVRPTSRASSHAGMFGMFFSHAVPPGRAALQPHQTGLAFLPFRSRSSRCRSSARAAHASGSAPSGDGVAFSVSTVGMLLMTQLAASSSYVSLLAPLMLFGAANGLAFVRSPRHH